MTGKSTFPTAADVRDLLEYDAETGIFTWKRVKSNRAKIGGIAGTLHKPTGYRYISIDRKMYKAHRLAWLHVYGEWPKKHLDHINGVRDDNRISNLRAADASLNQQNLRSSRGATASGILGVYPNDKKNHPWRACIKIGSKWRQIGNFATKEEASAAYIQAKRKFHEGCTI